ncbi:MAG: bifunctional nuclease family protein [Saprospiraceae bacterium]|jgi:bifunctional DNase/RNase|nr:bifunctional nuclease family protein [Saprospiraceae bacterium]MBK7795060.1 bifunctional nuclease family protein [Saprospiraceae bacterium]MBL0262052.1 bifunctional nuclease family protein [Saprospiraceae bacterium]
MAAKDKNRVELEIIALSHSVSQNQNYAIILGEMEGVRRLPIVIGGFEAQAIAVVLERMTPNRPLTHDLFKNTMDAMNVELVEVLISDLIDGIFFSKLIFNKDGERIEVDSRTSDALAMAVRFNCPIYTMEFIMDTAGVELEEEESNESSSTKKITRKSEKDLSFDAMPSDELNKLLTKVLEAEDYEKAAKIRDELNRRK